MSASAISDVIAIVAVVACCDAEAVARGQAAVTGIGGAEGCKGSCSALVMPRAALNTLSHSALLLCLGEALRVKKSCARVVGVSCHYSVFLWED